MSRTKLQKWLGVILTSLLLASCASQSGCGGTPAVKPTAPEPDPEPVRTPAPVPVVPSAPADFLPNPDGTGMIAVDAEGNPLDPVVNFAFDEAELRAGDLRVLGQHATRLTRHRNQSVVIEGHCDERGTREYNLALGDRRATSVQDFFLAQGVRASQIQTVSWGEERPVDTASNETAWAKNRRVELNYK